MEDNTPREVRLIALVENYEGLYNPQHVQYSDQQKRHEMWNEISRRLRQPAKLCKEQWNRIRDNHRKALILRRSKSGEAASKMKPPKYDKELAFLNPYLVIVNDSNQPFDWPEVVLISDEKSQSEEFEMVPDYEDLPSSETEDPPLALENYPVKAELAEVTNDQQNNLTEFFINMAKTVKDFPLRDQVRIKAQLFDLVNKVEMRIANALDDGLYNHQVKPNYLYKKSSHKLHYQKDPDESS